MIASNSPRFSGLTPPSAFLIARLVLPLHLIQWMGAGRYANGCLRVSAIPAGASFVSEYERPLTSSQIGGTIRYCDDSAAFLEGWQLLNSSSNRLSLVADPSNPFDSTSSVSDRSRMGG